jgi:hypothetical protein
VTVRGFDPQRDRRETLVALWNEAYGTRLFRPEHFDRLNPDNVLLVESDEGEVVGFALLLDGGLPYLVLDHVYLRPPYHRVATLRAVFQAVDAVCRARGVLWYAILLHQDTPTVERWVSLLRRRAQWYAECSEMPVLCRPLMSPVSS